MLSNPAQEIFANQCARGKSQSEAYTIAGYKENPGNASNLAARPEVAARINEIKMIIAARAQVTAERVLAEMARIGFADITQAVRVENGKVQVIDSAQLSADVTAAIAEVSETRDGVKLKMHDKRAALEALGKHLGLFKENVNIDVNLSLADLVNGSYKLDRGALAPAGAQDATPAQLEHLEAGADRQQLTDAGARDRQELEP
jgi:phage terminase small subunit